MITIERVRDEVNLLSEGMVFDVLTGEEAVKLAHDLLDAGEKALKYAGDVHDP